MYSKFDDAIITAVVCRAGQDGKIGRTVLQKIVYFLKAKGVPVRYKFDIQHYGPYSQDLYFRMDDLVAEEIVCDVSVSHSRSEYQRGPKAEMLLEEHKIALDKYQDDTSIVLEQFNGISSEEMGLLATTHYIQCSHTIFYNAPPEKNLVVRQVMKMKKRFTREQVEDAYHRLESAGVFNWLGN